MRTPPRHELDDMALRLHGPVQLHPTWTAKDYAASVARALHGAGREVRVAPDPDFPRWLEVTDQETGDIHARFRL